MAQKPLIRKLGTIAVDKVEANPIVFKDRLYRFEWYRNGKCFQFVDSTTGKVTVQFAHGWCFGCAFVHDDTVYVTGSQHDEQLRMWVSEDLIHWDSYLVFDLPGYTIFNTSICRDDEKFVLMFEIGEPVEEAGRGFTARFATSDDLRTFTLTPKECVYAKDRYTAPHCLRYWDGYYYNFYLESLQKGPSGQAYEQYVVRSKDLVHWESSPLNPVLAASDEDKVLYAQDLRADEKQRVVSALNINNSDIDMCEYKGKLVITYSWGNQQGVEHLAEGVYNGTLGDFLTGWFPEDHGSGEERSS